MAYLNVPPPTPAQIWAKKFIKSFSFSAVPMEDAKWQAFRSSDGQSVEVWGKTTVLPNVTEEDIERNKAVFALIKGYTLLNGGAETRTQGAVLDEEKLEIKNSLARTTLQGDSFTISLSGGARMYINAHLPGL